MKGVDVLWFAGQLCKSAAKVNLLQANVTRASNISVIVRGGNSVLFETLSCVLVLSPLLFVPRLHQDTFHCAAIDPICRSATEPSVGVSAIDWRRLPRFNLLYEPRNPNIN